MAGHSCTEANQRWSLVDSGDLHKGIPCIVAVRKIFSNKVEASQNYSVQKLR